MADIYQEAAETIVNADRAGAEEVARRALDPSMEAGVTMFAAANFNTTKSIAWNVARACTIIKPAMDVAEIPAHLNVGMGVGGVPMSPYPPVDAVSRVSRALVDILTCDGWQVGMGDRLGMACTHAPASGMGGMRTAADLVGRMQMTRGMRLNDAKARVADKLGCAVADLADAVVMHDVRRDLGLRRMSV